MPLFNKPSTQQNGKMGEMRGGSVQQNVCGLTACFACARRRGQPLAGRRCDGSAGSRAGQAGPQVPQVSGASGSLSPFLPRWQLVPAQLCRVLFSSLSPAAPFPVAGTACSQIKVAKFSFFLHYLCLALAFLSPFCYP